MTLESDRPVGVFTTKIIVPTISSAWRPDLTRGLSRTVSLSRRNWRWSGKCDSPTWLSSSSVQCYSRFWFCSVLVVQKLTSKKEKPNQKSVRRKHASAVRYWMGRRTSPEATRRNVLPAGAPKLETARSTVSEKCSVSKQIRTQCLSPSSVP